MTFLQAFALLFCMAWIVGPALYFGVQVVRAK